MGVNNVVHAAGQALGFSHYSATSQTRPGLFGCVVQLA